MEYITQVLQMIAQYGFPIVMCCVVCYLWYAETQKHQEESEKWISCIDNNTAVIERVLEKLN